MPKNTFVAVTVLGAHHPMLRQRIRECGTLFRFESHVETAHHGIGLRVTCLCPEGHGVARLPWNGWLEPHMGRYDLLVLPEPVAEQPTASPEAVHPLACAA